MLFQKIGIFIIIVFNCFNLNASIPFQIGNGNLIQQYDKCIYNNNSHAAFTTLYVYNDVMYLAFREANYHRETKLSKGIIKVMYRDGQKWQIMKIISKDNTDLRDPFFVVINNTLYLYTANGYYSKLIKGRWSNLEKIHHNINHSITLWKFRQYKDGLFYGIGYKKGKWPALVKSKDGINWELIQNIKIGGDATEADLAFYNDSIYICLRIDLPIGSHSMWGMGKYPFDSLKWSVMDISIASPDILRIPNSHFFLLSGREYMTKGNKIESITIPIYMAKGDGSVYELYRLKNGSKGDKGYTSFCWHNDILYMSYYCGQGDTQIRLAAFKLK